MSNVDKRAKPGDVVSPSHGPWAGRAMRVDSADDERVEVTWCAKDSSGFERIRHGEYVILHNKVLS